MNLLKPLEIKDSTEIKTTPEKIWDFFTNLEENYKTWHPQDHVIFKWTKGKPMESGAHWYGEEILNGELKKLKGKIGEVIPCRKIVFRYSFPISIASPGFEWHIESKGSYSVFTTIGYIRCFEFYRSIAKSHMDAGVEAGKKHIKEEGENLKRILENRNL